MRGTLLGGRYRIQNKIGEGGMANVYVAIDERLQRRVAVKILHRHLAENQELRQRFFMEARAISSFDHPNILKIHDFSGEDSDDIWIVSEVLRGANLNEFTSGFPGKWLHPIVAAIIVREILRALERAHHEGLIHRDIKPENIMVLDDGHIKLMDFGIAKNMRANSMTQTGTFMGSPSYMSPEQIRGKAVDERSDLYSLGVLFYEIVTGRLPFVGNSTHDVILKICEGKFKHPVHLVPNLPSDIDQMIVKAMSKYPSSRYQEARTFGRDIEIFLGQHHFEESSIEFERYFSDRQKFEDRLRKLAFHNTTTVEVSQAKPQVAVAKPASPTKTQYVTHQIPAELPKRVATAQQQNIAPPLAIPRTERAIRIQQQNMPAVAANAGNRARPAPQQVRAQPKRRQRILTKIYIPTSTIPPSGHDWTGQLLGIILVGLVLFGISISFAFLHRKLQSPPLPTPRRTAQPPVLPSDVNKVAAPTPQETIAPTQKPRVTDSLPRKTSKAAPVTPRTEQKIIPSPSVALAKPIVGAPQKTLSPTSSPLKIIDTRIQISSNPAAEIFIDGERRGTTIDKTANSGWIIVRPNTSLQLELRRSGYASFRKTITLGPQESRNLGAIKLSPESIYTLNLSSNATKVLVSIVNLGSAAQRSLALNDGGESVTLPGGRYRIRFISRNQTIERNIVLGGSEISRSMRIDFNEQPKE